jgi:hypothetical protein
MCKGWRWEGYETEAGAPEVARPLYGWWEED